jgi:hypothetical protein
MARKLPAAPSAGAALVAAIRAEMDVAEIDPTATEEALLRLAHELADRIDRLEHVVADDGEILTSATGVVRVHPAAVEHRQLALALARVLGGVVIGDSSAGKNPVKQRAAAARWANHNKRQSAVEQWGA